MIKLKKKIIRLKRKNPLIVDVGYHATAIENLKSIIDNGFKRSDGSLYSSGALRLISYYFFDGKRPIYFLDIPNLEKITDSMKSYFVYKDIILKVNIKDYDQEPDYNMLVIDYNFKILNEHDVDVQYGYYHSTNRQILDNNYHLVIDDIWLKSKKYKCLRTIFMKYGSVIETRGLTYIGIKLKDIKNSDEIKTELIFFTETLCVNKNIPSSKILDYYEIEK